MLKAKIALVTIGLLATISAAVGSKARTYRAFYAPTIHGGPCYVTTLLFLTTTEITNGEAYEIARQETIDSCVEFCTASE